MALPFVPTVVKVTFSGTIGGSSCINILHFQYSGAGELTDANADAYAVDFGGLWDSFTSVNTTGTYTHSDTIVEDLSSATAGVGAAGSAVAGGGTSSAVDAALCCLVTHTIARRYRGGHPRTYLPAMSRELMSSDRVWAAPDIVLQQSAWDSFIAGCVSASEGANPMAAFVSVSYFSGGVPRLVPLIDVIAGSTVEPVYATQRRRIGR